MSIRMPCRMAMGIISFPEYLVMEGSSTSIELTPAAEIGASFPKYFLMIGVPRSAIISRKILVSRAMVGKSTSHCHTVEHAPLTQ